MKMRKVVSIIEGLMKSEAYGLMTQMLFKEAGTKYASQAWTVHQDNAYHQNPNGATLTINIACKDADKETGTLYLFPGSHKEGILPFTKRKSFREDEGKNPGNTLDLPKKYLKHKKDIIMKKIPMNKFGEPKDVANLALFLSSNASSYITGQTFHINGGMLMV